MVLGSDRKHYRVLDMDYSVRDKSNKRKSKRDAGADDSGSSSGSDDDDDDDENGHDGYASGDRDGDVEMGGA